MGASELLVWLKIAQILLYPLVAYAVWKVRDYEYQSQRIRERIIKLEDFKESHDRWCGERSDRNEKEHGAMQANIERSIESIHGIRNDVFREIGKLTAR